MSTKGHALSVAVTICLISIGFGPAAAAGEVSRITLFTNHGMYNSQLKDCSRGVLGNYEIDDSYKMAEVDALPTIDAPSAMVSIRVSFSQACSVDADKYTRSVEIIAPDGTHSPLARNDALSWSYKSDSSIACSLLSCRNSLDVYQVQFGGIGQSGIHGLRFSTTYLDRSCSFIEDFYVCETDVPYSHSFVWAKFITVHRTGVLGDWEIGAPEPVPASIEIKSWTVNQRTLAVFEDRVATLTRMQRSQVRAAVNSNPNAKKFVCTGIRYYDQPMSLNIILRKRAKAACELAKELNPGLSTWYQNKRTWAPSYVGKVLLTIKSPVE
jgi:hypothetical protein